MFQIEKISNNIASKIASELSLDNDKKEVIAYGTFTLLQMAFSIFLVIIFGWLFHVVIQALIISFSTSILRKYSGGVHASSPGICIIIGTIICIGLAMFISFIISPFINIYLVLIMGLIAFIWAYYMIYKLAPVDSPAKPIRRKEKKKRMKRVSIVILSVYLFLVIVNILLYNIYEGQKLIIYILCIYIGMVWQVFSLTSIGHLILTKFDTLLNQILNFKRRCV